MYRANLVSTGNGRFAYVPTGFDKKEFDNFCRLAHVWNRQKESIIIVEELAAVTNTGKASSYWGILVNQSLGLGATLFATVQRGQEVNKSVMNASSYLYVYRHNTDDDAKYMSKNLGVESSAIPHKPLIFTLWSPAKGLPIQGHVEFKQNSPVFINSSTQRRLTIKTTTGLFSGLAYISSLLTG